MAEELWGKHPDGTPKRLPATREEAMRWQAAMGRLTNPTEKERIVDELLLKLPLPDEET